MDTPTFSLSSTFLSHVVERPMACASLAKTPFLSNCVDLLQHCLRRHEGGRVAGLLQILAGFAAHREVAAYVMQNICSTRLLDTVLDVMNEEHVSATEWALFLVHNLAVAGENAAYLTSNARALPMISAALEGSSSYAKAVACAASALSALCYHEQRTKNTLRNMDGLQQRLAKVGKELSQAVATAVHSDDRSSPSSQGTSYLRRADAAIRQLQNFLFP